MNLEVSRHSMASHSTQHIGKQTGPESILAENSFSKILKSQMNGQPCALEIASNKPIVNYEFPPAAAPLVFKEAWEIATEGMDPGDRMTYELRIWGNLHPEYSSLPGETPMAAPPEGDLSTYRGIVKHLLESLELRPELYTRDQLFKDNAFFGKLNLLMDGGKSRIMVNSGSTIPIF